MKTGVLIAISCVFFLAACSDYIEYSPYDVNIGDTKSNLIESSAIPCSNTDTCRFAFISDVHNDCDLFIKAIENINRKHDIQFVICGGDITNTGLAQEYEWYTKASRKLKCPLITVIGNHDYLSNGYKIYCKVFGNSNFSFTADQYKFVIFNDITWENPSGTPDYEWLGNELSDQAHYHIVLAHIPPFAREMAGNNQLLFDQIVTAENTMLCLYGHMHSYSDSYYNGVRTLVAGAVNDKEYYIVNLIKNQAIIERICF